MISKIKLKGGALREIWEPLQPHPLQAPAVPKPFEPPSILQFPKLELIFCGLLYYGFTQACVAVLLDPGADVGYRVGGAIALVFVPCTLMLVTLMIISRTAIIEASKTIHFVPGSLREGTRESLDEGKKKLKDAFLEAKSVLCCHGRKIIPGSAESDDVLMDIENFREPDQDASSGQELGESPTNSNEQDTAVVESGTRKSACRRHVANALMFFESAYTVLRHLYVVFQYAYSLVEESMGEGGEWEGFDEDGVGDKFIQRFGE